MGITKEQFIIKAKEKFGDSFEYIGEYIGFQQPMEISCKKCGLFSQSPRNHLRAKGCPNCNSKKKKTFEIFYKEVKQKHGDKHIINEEDYNGLQKDVIVKCVDHGIFKIKAYNLLRTIGCKKCAKESEKQKKFKTQEQFIKESIEVHGIFYEYPQQYVGANITMDINCPIHGVFSQSPSNHIRGRGCPKCGVDRQKEKMTNTLEYFKSVCKSIHNSFYDYSLITEYINNKETYEIICPKHGMFKQYGYTHMRGAGCPKCANKISKPEIEICELLESYNIKYESSNRKILKGLELDIIIPEKKIAIEYNGLMFHREGLYTKGGIGGGKHKNYHLNKTKLAKEAGYKLIHIFEDEWILNKTLVKNKILHILGESVSEKVYARKCKIKTITSKESKAFLNEFHIQRSDSTAIRYGSFYENKLVAVMTFLKSKDNSYKLNRFATDSKYRCIGLASKNLTHFIREHKPSKIITFADRRWTLSAEKNVYTTIGFDLVETQPPVYHYYNVKTQEIFRYNRQRFMKHKILKKYPELSEEKTGKELMVGLGYDRIWDCGNFKYVYEIK